MAQITKKRYMAPQHGGVLSVVLGTDVDRVSFGVSSPLAMILDALERGDAQLSPGSNQVENF